MCGIYGHLSLSARDRIDAAAGEAATDLLTHRGPDERGVWRGSGVFLGMRRLSIIDLDHGHQPMWNEDKSACVVYNGELYNFRDLRRELESRSHSFRTTSDTEVVLHAYEEWGSDCVRRFNGMFAFAVWDERNRRLFLARDRIGEKPLYYFVDDDRLVFASEIKALLADPGVPRRINPRGLANFLSFGHGIAPETIYAGIHKLLPGHRLEARDGRVLIEQYWDIGDDPQLPPGLVLEESQYAERVLSLLDDAVRSRMVADVPVGAFLSGGIDSSAVVALMKRHAENVATFSLGFTVGGAYNELSDARRAARALGTDHHELEVQHLDLPRTLEELVYHYDEPFGDSAAFPVYLLARFARERVKVVLTGDGGDELFGGYRRYAADAAAGLYQRLPPAATQRWIPSLVGALPRCRRFKRAARVLQIEDPGRRYPAWLAVLTPEMRAELLDPEISRLLDGHDPARSYPRHYRRLGGADHLNRLMYVDVKTWLPDAYLEKTDKATMARGLEARLPMLDHRLAELAFQIPGRYKVRGLSTKRILKRALEAVVPQEVLRRRKHGFSVPTDPWFRGPLKSFAFEVLLDGRARDRGYVDARVVERLWREHADGREVWDESLWLLLNLELWHRTYMDSGRPGGVRVPS